MILEAKNISFRYGENGREILKDFSLKADSSERVGLAAPSGFGKTTLCKILSGYEKPDRGEILLDGKTLDQYGSYCPVQLIWQHPEQAVNPRLRMKSVLEEGDQVDPALVERLGIEKDWMNRFPVEISGGEMQRFCIARAMGKRTRFLLADEISTMLDLITQSQIWHFLIEETRRRQMGMIVVSHSPELLERVCTRVIDLQKTQS
ncbi:ABC transporter ATP-binding protein [Blautia sp.]|jgi:ABC-type dipeptide/oligopeptide/nickel transport system ATPase subunit|uniref:ABC transporter ATP-binding protein n=1 Tax=Blautia sp. TaxID=1955243 RepID=UPI002E7851F8|nr:ATP-binding cassette domain-containing protein [Blautia sp.]MED9883013.1 ATP-binding cassette domain-containing protein [Blautia sp.]